MFGTLAFLSLVAELVVGYPDRVVRGIGHPVIWMGALIAVLEKRLNQPNWTFAQRRAAGLLCLASLLLATILPAIALQIWLPALPFGMILLAILASSLLAQRSLHDHVAAVAAALERSGIEGGRAAVSKIVGRDPEHLDEAAVCRAAVESLAENFSDAVVAPAIWLGIGGLPGGVAYKAVNTADSMIGHRNARYAAFGWAAARLDDLVNLPASRLSALLIVAAAFALPGASGRRAWATVWRDAKNHRSPNAGWPEAATAGALGLSIAGPRAYGGVISTDSPMGEGGRRELVAADIRAALRLYWVADALLLGLFAAWTIIEIMRPG